MLVPRSKIGGISEIMLCRILMFMWSLEALYLEGPYRVL